MKLSFQKTLQLRHASEGSAAEVGVTRHEIWNFYLRAHPTLAVIGE
jgi:hypothetical protein